MLARRTRAASGRRARPGRSTPPETSETPTTVAPFSCELGRGDAADVAEALDDAARARARFQPSRSHARSITITTPAPVASCRKTEPPIETGLPVTISGHGVALLHRVGVHHPGHRLLVRRHVRRRDVDLRADERREIGGEPAREPGELAPATARAGRSARRPSRRRTAAAAARTSRSSTSRAPRTRRG